MGGEQSTTQVQSFVQTSILNATNDVLINKNTTVDQSSTGSQIIKNVPHRG